MAKKKKWSDPYSEEVIKRKRTFPTLGTVGLYAALVAQIVLILFAVLYTPTPQDRIEQYELTATPNADGTLDLEYRFVWTALDQSEDLTWIEIGMPNKHFDFLEASPNITSYEKYVDEDYVSARLYLDRPYKGGETLTLSFRVRQRDMLCHDDTGAYFYELVPGWFNATPVEHYRFTWKGAISPSATNAPSIENGASVWEGSMPCGSYVSMQVQYPADAFYAVSTVKYEQFDGSGVADELKGDKLGAIFFVAVFCILLLVFQIYIIDSVVSYHRGRGFLKGYGHHVHIYGRSNPKYEAERNKHSNSGGRAGGGGCACACACACAGGGRAGCSQKDTKPFPLKKTHTNETKSDNSGGHDHEHI